MIEGLAERLDAVQERRNGLNVAYANLTREIADLESEVVRLMLLNLADGDSRITSFRFTAESEYDDEGSYYWVASIKPEGEGLGEWPENADDEDQFLEVEHNGDKDSIPLAFESNNEWEGNITVERLRELWAATQ